MTLGVLLGDHRVGLARAGEDRRFYLFKNGFSLLHDLNGGILKRVLVHV